ncbi:MAG: peptide chain release factor N(5)-glutamine methyltransferase [Dehalococcoidia bacterium]|nr:peptide chain release factor N(5)-glutamine methyltransferase [Dehalococcoidia bacterium]
MVRVIDALVRAEAEISVHGGPYARLEAEVLLCHVLDIDRTRLYAALQDMLPEDCYGSLSRLIERSAKEPLAYLTNTKEFCGREFYVDGRVLVPRPETETLVEATLQVAKTRVPVAGQSLKVADIGTGSGIIAITLALAIPNVSMYAVDVSKAALEVAAINCSRHEVSDRITLLHGDLLIPLPDHVDIIVANLPYVTEDELAAAEHDWSTMPLAAEPRLALNGGSDGLEVIQRLIAMASQRLTPGGSILLEIGYGQGSKVISIVKRYFVNARCSIHQDLAGLDRVLVVGLSN